MGAGVQAYEAYEFADSHGVRVVGSECSTVGLAGGFTQGGGHSILSSEVGLAADNALEWEVVTGEGKHLIASKSENSDLYWALSGGGGGTYAVVLSLTVKAFDDGPIGGASLSFNTSHIKPDIYYHLISTWQSHLPSLVDAGGLIIYQARNTSFNLLAATYLSKTKAEVDAHLKPFLTTLQNYNVSFTYSSTSSPTYLKHYANYFGPLPDGIYPVGQLLAGRLIPRHTVTQNNTALTDVIRQTVSSGTYYIGGLALNANHTATGSNSVLPAWRSALIELLVASDFNFNVPFNDMLSVQNRLSNEIMPAFYDLTPGSGTYLNEGDFQTKAWKQDFYGENYDKLRRVKGRYDPHDVFYARTAVGSDEWAVGGDGRLCRIRTTYLP